MATDRLVLVMALEFQLPRLGGCDLSAQGRLDAGAFRMNRGKADRGVLPDHAEVVLSQRWPPPLQRRSM